MKMTIRVKNKPLFTYYVSCYDDAECDHDGDDQKVDDGGLLHIHGHSIQMDDRSYQMNARKQLGLRFRMIMQEVNLCSWR